MIALIGSISFQIMLVFLEMKKEAKAFWPRWCLYVAWLICAATSAGAGYITLLYGLSFGKVVQEKWLFSFFLSVFEDIFIFQPGKVCEK